METSFAPHPIAVEHLPPFITAPGQTDVLFNFVVVFMVVAVFTAGVLYMRLHALPEHLAHRTRKVQIEIVGVLGLIALFTHSPIFWIAALLLAMIDLPDFLSPLRSMAKSLRRVAGGYPTTPTLAEAPPESVDRTGSELPKPQTMPQPVNSSETVEKAAATDDEANGSETMTTNQRAN
ncbi:hypothetical protein [Mesorhizobium sp. GR13]|uniref:hypothetical protein n=1 Tax=Mesorhizobium sp. GR13 TaxID=2562308 RepID=UPI0010C0BCEE|nr:hypothetical protein [Mesorhizobium sp. GR13]